MLTKKEIFDKVVAHLLTQQAQSKNHYGDCLYRSPDGLKCAVGCLIPDELYDKEIEGAAVGGCNAPILECANILREILLESGIPDEKGIWEMLEDLQKIHDNANVDRWERALTLARNKHINT
jgi:hypothetical protein